ncbi:glycosyltransferase family 4 protein [Idiomarina loihiensis]|uniref:glycosyltransferase family 4 protein n=1 Tax=Idiomarina loihiensis TaxID=135577 RepID=UPI0038509A68
MKILFLSFYFPPDLSAGSFRASALLDALMHFLLEEDEVHVITTSPNRYSDFGARADEEEVRDKLIIKRVCLPEHNNGMLDQSRAFFTYAKGAKKFVADDKYDLVFSTSSRLMTATLGSYFSRKLNVPLYLDIRDLFVDTIKDVLPRKTVWLAKPFFSVIEKWTVSKANRLNVVSAGFLPYFKSKYPNVSTTVFTNGIDDVFIGKLGTEALNSSTIEITDGERKNKPVEIVYAGNIGEGQGLHRIIPLIAKQLEGKAKFRVIGSGGRLTELKNSLAKANCKNVTLEVPIKRDELIEVYQSADILLLHLNDYDAFHKVLPSKLFEYGALGKPILAGVAGFAARFIRENLDNAAIFSPCDVDDAIRAFESLDIGTRPRTEFVRKFNRKAIMDSMAEDIIKCHGEGM